MIETIFVPIDISEKEAGATALKLAQDLAKIYGSKLMLLNVVEQVPGFVAAQIPAGFHEKALLDAAARLNEIASEHGVAGTAKVVEQEGHPSTENSRIKQALTSSSSLRMIPGWQTISSVPLPLVSSVTRIARCW